MKKLVFVLFVIISVLYFFQYSRFPAADTANSLSKLNKALKRNLESQQVPKIEPKTEEISEVSK